MPRPPSTQPTDVELRILSILWAHGPSPVRVIHKQLSADRQTNYSTTVKMLSVMLDKGLLTRDETVRPHVYRAVRSQAATQKRILREMIDKVYAGSSLSLVLQALSTQEASPDELEEIRRLLDELEGRT